MGFPAADPQGLFTLALYRSLKGSIQDPQGRPILQPEILEQVLQLYSEGSQQGVFPAWLAQYHTDEQIWQAYREGSTQWVVTWSSSFLSEMPINNTVAVLPPMGQDSVSVATGWAWALADPAPERRQIAIRLAEFLTQDEFLKEWTVVAGYLPVRPSSLTGWTDANLRSTLSQVVLSAEMRPTNDVLTSLGPIFADATLQVVKRQSDAKQAAQSAAERLAISNTR